jgi:cytoskeleton protein RodZ
MGSFGDRLRKEREERGITLDDISLTTKIGTRLLRALEEEKFDQLPGGIFNKGFVRAYARHVGLDEDQAVADYMTAIGANQPKPGEAIVVVPPPLPPEPVAASAPDPAIRLAREIQRRVSSERIPWGLLAILLLFVALAFATWSYLHRPPRIDKEKVVPTSNLVAEPTPTSAQVREPGPDKTQRVLDAATTAIPPVAGTSARGSPVEAAALHAAVPVRSADSPRGRFTVRLQGNDDSQCWVSIAVDGEPPVEFILTAPEQKVFYAKMAVVARIGSVGALDIFFNGKKLPLQGEYGEVKTLTFHPDGLQAPALEPPAQAP